MGEEPEGGGALERLLLRRLRGSVKKTVGVQDGGIYDGSIRKCDVIKNHKTLLSCRIRNRRLGAPENIPKTPLGFGGVGLYLSGNGIHYSGAIYVL